MRVFRLYNTTRVADVTMEKLEYQTDNGAQYCFCKEDCDRKIIDVSSA
jgi:hypothetical protein